MSGSDARGEFRRITASLQGRYASALYDLASERKLVTAVEGDLDTLAEALAQAPISRA